MKAIQLEFEFMNDFPLTIKDAYRCPICGYNPIIDECLGYIRIYCRNYRSCDYGRSSISLDLNNIDYNHQKAEDILVKEWNKIVLNYMDHNNMIYK